MTANRVIGFGFVLLAVIMFFASEQITEQQLMGDPGPLLLPHVVAALMAGLGVVLAFMREGASSTDEEERGPRGGLRALIPSAIAVIGYVVLFKYTGFTFATAAYLFAAIAILGDRDLKSRIIYAAVAIAISLVLGYVLTEVLELPLPGVLA